VTTDDLAAALRACADGRYPLEAGSGLLISNGAFLRRDDFTSLDDQNTARLITVISSLS
jgi:hypothetical protein